MVPFAVPIERLICGSVAVCGLDLNGEVVCWHAWTLDALTPTPVSVVDFDVDTHACGLTGPGELACWGTNDDDPEANPPAGQFIAVAVGHRLSCALTLEGAVRCWGEDRWAALETPPGRFTRLAVGGGHACALREDGRVLCWGQAQDCFWHGQLMEDCSVIPAAIGEVYASASP